MTKQQLARALETIGWSNRELAAALDCDEKLVRRWRGDTDTPARGQRNAPAAVPEPVAAWLAELALRAAPIRAALAQLHKENPPPKHWKTW
jgi:hypothetical protein